MRKEEGRGRKSDHDYAKSNVHPTTQAFFYIETLTTSSRERQPTTEAASRNSKRTLGDSYSEKPKRNYHFHM